MSKPIYSLEKTTWLFGDLARPLLSNATFEAVLGLIDNTGQISFQKFERELKSPDAKWNESSKAGHLGELGEALATILDNHFLWGRNISFDIPRETFEDPGVLELSSSRALQVRLERYFNGSNIALSELPDFSVEGFLRSGSSWEVVLELVHLFDWVRISDGKVTIRVPRGDPGLWTEAVIQNLTYRYSLKNGVASALLGRFELGVPHLTLAAAGASIGVTRERFRQIFRVAEEVLINQDIAPPLGLESAMQNPSQLQEKLPGWSKKGLFNLMRIAGYWRDTDADISKLDTALEKALDNYELLEAVRNEIDIFGLVHQKSLHDTVSRFGEILAGHELEILRSSVTRILAVSDRWVLVKKTKDPTFLNVIRNQLALGVPLSASDLYSGLQRRASSRSHSHDLLSYDSFFSLLRNLGDFVEDAGKYALREPLSPRSEGHQGWMLKQVMEAPDSCISIDELVLRASAAGLNVNTTGLYAYNLEELRAGDKLVWIVGREPSELTKAALVISMDSDEIPTVFDYLGSNDGAVVLEFQFGSVFMRSGQATISAPIARLIGDNGRRIRCECGESSETLIRVDSEQLVLRGAHWLRTHVADSHFGTNGIGIGSKFQIELFEQQAIIRMPAGE